MISFEVIDQSEIENEKVKSDENERRELAARAKGGLAGLLREEWTDQLERRREKGVKDDVRRAAREKTARPCLRGCQSIFARATESFHQSSRHRRSS